MCKAMKKRGGLLARWLFSNPSSKRKANRNNPAVVVLVKLCHRDLHAGAKAQVKSLSDLKSTQDKAGCQKHFLLSIQNAARPKRGILFEHRPDSSFDFIINRSIEDDRPT